MKKYYIFILILSIIFLWTTSTTFAQSSHYKGVVKDKSTVDKSNLPKSYKGKMKTPRYGTNPPKDSPKGEIDVPSPPPRKGTFKRKDN